MCFSYCRGGLHLYKVVGIVFENIQIVLLSDAINVLPPLKALSCTGWILSGWYSVQKMRFLSLPRLLVPQSQDFVHILRDRAFIVYSDSHKSYT